MDTEMKKLKERGSVLKREVRRQTAGYILTALGLVAGLAWNEAIKAFIEYIVPVSANTLFAKFLYATVITVMVVAVSMYFARSNNPSDS